jgi:hypothetical protein
VEISHVCALSLLCNVHPEAPPLLLRAPPSVPPTPTDNHSFVLRVASVPGSHIPG